MQDKPASRIEELLPGNVAGQPQAQQWANRDDFEVDVVLEFGSVAVAGIEVKAAATVVESDLRGLRKLREATGQRFTSGVVLYDGTASVSFGDGLFAVPIRRVWEL